MYIGHGFDSNYSLTLSNGDECLICPPLEEIKGTMQASGAVPITIPKSQAGREGIVDTYSVPVDGKMHPQPRPMRIPQGPVPFSPAVDMTQTTQMVDMTRPGSSMRRE